MDYILITIGIVSGCLIILTLKSMTLPWALCLEYRAGDGETIYITKTQRKMLRSEGWPTSSRGRRFRVTTQQRWRRPTPTSVLREMIADTYEAAELCARYRLTRNLRSRYGKTVAEKVRNNERC